jgi:hypothetical protein
MILLILIKYRSYLIQCKGTYLFYKEKIEEIKHLYIYIYICFIHLIKFLAFIYIYIYFSRFIGYL